MKEIEINFKSERDKRQDSEGYGESDLMCFHYATKGGGYSKSLLSRAFTKLVPKEEWKGMNRAEVIAHVYKYSDPKYR
jgi:hypothetical protein